MDQTVTYNGVVGRRCSDVGSFLPLHSSVHPALWCKDLVHEPAHWADAGGFPPHGGMKDLGKQP